ncbi:MAG: histidine triad nucleotide-binding protein [Calditrichaceae bacterium]|nr:histidine triad nucleotide-binding protein [Calditrichia bacterium]NUQ41639.1 histidine triad nucleotide-binding protein [Calditrichaceae bacterium]
MPDCIFCKIVRGEIPSRKVYEDDEVLAFHDLSPQAPVHVLLIPKLHVARIADLEDHHEPLLGRLIIAANKVAGQLNIKESGFRLVINNGENANQTVFHLHLHLLGGRRFTWPPG